jgi:membrane fusion protein (multidrug efflux system)
MYVRAVLEEGVKDQGLLVPQQAVSRDSTGKPQAYVVGKDDKLERRDLETDRAIGDQWLIRSGLNAGDQLVIDGLQRAAPGVTVKTVPWQAPPVTQAPAPSDLH